MPECLGPIENQGECGSCWAFTSSGLLSDRYCIHSKGKIRDRLSPQEMIDCNFENFSCLGGYLTTTIDYLQVDGVVTNQCQAYTGHANKCSYSCDDASVPRQKFYCAIGSLKVVTTADEIKKELRENGPMMMGLEIYEDFMSYKSGIYKQVTGANIGGHAMKLIGYGEDPVEGLFWVLQNQWEEDWGERGYI